jgi:cell division protein FtsB
MPDGLFEVEKNAAASADERVRMPMRSRVLKFVEHVWRPSASVLAVALAGLIVWHGIAGRNGLLVWQQKSVEDKQLQKEIDDLNQENARLRNRVQRLKTNPDAIGMVAHDKLHYAKSNEVIVNLPPEQTQPAPAGR